jgi:hypothetical protein
VATILRAADTMMYEAKVTRDNVVVAGRGAIGSASKTEIDSGSRRTVSEMLVGRSLDPR